MLDLASSVILSYKQAYYLKLEYQVKIVFHLVTQPIESSNFFLYDKFHGLPRSLMYFRKQTTRFNKVRYTLLFLRTVFWNEQQICSTKDIEEPIWFKIPWTYTLTVLQ